MLLEEKSLKKFVICSIDGEIGKIKEFFFHDENWRIRYLVANTGNWLKRRPVLIAPQALKTVDLANECLVTNLSRKQIMNSPPLESHMPVSRQCERDYFKYYSWPNYEKENYQEDVFRPLPQYTEDAGEINIDLEKKSWDPNLRSARDTIGYIFVTLSGEFGRVIDYILDTENWSVRYLVVDTQDKWFDKKILVSPKWIKKINWSETRIFADFTCETFKQSPDYTGISMLTREYETALFAQCDLPGYWTNMTVKR